MNILLKLGILIAACSFFVSGQESVDTDVNYDSVADCQPSCRSCKSVIESVTEVNTSLDELNDALEWSCFLSRVVKKLNSYIVALKTQISNLSRNLEKTNTELSKVKNEVTEMRSRFSQMDEQYEKMEASFSRLSNELEKIKTNKHPSFDSVKIGRWLIQTESGDIALVLRDTNSEGDKRYAFYNGGHSDMYKSGTGGNIGANSIIFPKRWSISEGIRTTFLIFKDRAAGGDKRYAMYTNRYKDL